MPKKATPKPKPKPIVIPAKLFAGKTVIIAGRRIGFPDKQDISRFLIEQGATLSTTPTKKTDIILLGEGSATTKKKADKLIESGAADIQFMEEAIELVHHSHQELAAAITNPTNLERMVQWPSWVWRELDFEGFDYSGQSIGSRSNGYWSVEADFFAKCKFDRATLSNLSIDGGKRTGSCSFKQTKFQSVTFFDVPVSLVDIEGTDLSLRHSNQAKIKKATINGLVLYSPEQCHFIDVKVKKLTVEEDVWQGSKDCEFKNCKIEGLAAESTVFQDCTFDNCDFDSGVLAKSKFTKCNFSKSNFRNMEISGIVFRDCQWKSTQFADSILSDINFESSDVTSLSFKNCTSQIVSLTDKQLSNTKGLSAKDIYLRRSTPAIVQLAKLINTAEEIEVSMAAKLGKEIVKMTLNSDWYSEKYVASHGSNDESFLAAQGSVRTRKRNPLDTINGLNWLALKAAGADVDFGSLKVKSKKASLKGKALNELVVNAISDLFQTGEVSVAEVATKQRAKAKSKKQQIADLVSLLQSGNVKAINDARAELVNLKKFRKLDLKNAKLANVDLSELDLYGCDFSGSDLQGANFTGSDCRKAIFDDCQLQRAILVDTDFYQASLQNSNLRGANLDEAHLANAKLNQADLSNATIRNGTLLGADLTGAKLTRTRLNETDYDEGTTFPVDTSLATIQTLQWYGTGSPPDAQRQFRPARGKIDFPTFLERTRLLTDNARMNKALEMLEKQAIHLYVDANPKRLLAVVVNPKQIKKPYLVRISSDGKFSCCSHNLNPCGGLRGSLCKHLLMTMIGLVKAKKITAAKADKWINATKINRPELDKESMQTLMDYYQCFEEWQPVETSPEDFME